MAPVTSSQIRTILPFSPAALIFFSVPVHVFVILYNSLWSWESKGNLKPTRCFCCWRHRRQQGLSLTETWFSTKPITVRILLQIVLFIIYICTWLGDTSSHLAWEENGWFIQVNSVSAAACVDFPYGVSVPLHCIFPTHTLYTAFHVEENHSHLCNFRGQICGTIQREGSTTRTCVRRLTYWRRYWPESSMRF